MVQIHDIKPKTKKKGKKRIGRGGKRGTYSGRGIKGQKSRAGRKMRPEMRDTIKKLPKKRGYRFKSFREKAKPVNLAVLDKIFSDNEKVTPTTLLKKKVIEKKKGRMPAVKLLASGNITKKLLVSECQVSIVAKGKIEKAGGKVE
ncbi:MAG TPA: ribosomal protein L15 family protein [Candidatus Campbellbacteria bacterium]|nr:ribosomal protein L15 family protein [Candidatus Campbellbacteria bacterium]